MSSFDFASNLLLVLGLMALLLGGLVVLAAPLEWLAHRSERFAEWVDGVVEHVL